MSDPQTMSLPVLLTAEELRSRGQELADLTVQVESLEEEKSSSSAGFNQRIKLARANIGLVANIVSSGRENRDVEVAHEPDFVANKIDTVRLDTGEVVRSRPLTQEDRQRPIPIDAGAEG